MKVRKLGRVFVLIAYFCCLGVGTSACVQNIQQLYVQI